ncbi:protein translocase subunit SecF [Synechococcus elongatus]|uniref:Protein-export membrane protein SecF n=1 Tax=Synechococcus elongatus PCC 11802 TaxID=2283154 RepID=A0AAU6R5C5_SYNEL|nr:protein translocase subunit SecF [Synechococcus elongatus]QFZ91485.1 protein translocase subunit SecF [Synechococcus elongatus PCC 11802]
MTLQLTAQRRRWWWISSILVLLSIVGMAISWVQFGGPVRPGLDFIGGTRLQLERDCTKAQCDRPLEAGAIREVLTSEGLERSNVQVVGQEQQGFVISTGDLSPEARVQLQTKLSEAFGPFDPQQTQIDTVGPVLGQQLLISGLLALLVSFAGILVYLNFRFQRDYALLAILALLHDVFITAGVFAWLGILAGYEADSLFIVALLTITGFSVNDTVVIYDRIRETIALFPDDDIDEIVDLSVNQTLGRSINTTLTTLLPLVAIYIFGGATLQNFALTLIVGFVLGAYSSIFVASTLLGWWRKRTPRSPQPINAET